uniref:Klf5 isoform B n=1 Tax=Homo sapiens TaxID=9606 RepID=A0A0A0N0L7_HUMAN|nr:Klf5 isoform B [Homo sapiens]
MATRVLSMSARLGPAAASRGPGPDKM